MLPRCQQVGFPAIQFLSFDETVLPLGFLALRLSLNDKLFVEGGHIGYSIRPSQRGKGYGKEQLRLGLAAARKQGLERVLITCDEDNEASVAPFSLLAVFTKIQSIEVSATG